MNTFQKRTAIRIAAVSVLLASIAGPGTWFVACERAEGAIIALSIEEAHRFMHHHQAFNLSGPKASERAAEAAENIVGGLFNIAEIFDRSGHRLAKSSTPEGQEVYSALPVHAAPNYSNASFESLNLPGNRWILRIFVPLRESTAETTGPITGYFEGVRVMPPWQREHIFTSTRSAALMACLASLLCGAVLYPAVVRLSSDNESKTRKVLDSHIAMMEALGRAIAKRDSETGAHNYRGAWIASCIAQLMRLGEQAM